MATSPIQLNTQRQLMVSNQADATIETLLNTIISNIASSPTDIYMVSGSWKNHSGGYVGTVNKATLASYTIGYSGTIFDNGNNKMYGFSKIVNQNHETVKELVTVALN